MERKRIVILGGGFAGVYTARRLEKKLRRLGRAAEQYEVVLVNRDNYFVFQPMLPEVISGSIGILDTVSPLRRLLPGTTIVVREVEEIDVETSTIRTSPGVHPHPSTIRYDHLVLALGTVTDFRGLRGLPEHAMPFKNLADALALRNHVIGALEEASVEEEQELRRQLLTFVIAGGGFSGVEVAAELNDFVRSVARNYPTIDPKDLRVVLLHSQDRILPEVSPKLALFAQKILAQRGVELRLGTRLEAASAEAALLAGGERIETRTLVSTVPSSPHPLVDRLVLAKSDNGRLLVTPQLQVQGSQKIWALGDCALVPNGEGRTFAPPTAQHAVRQANTLADNIVAQIAGRPLRSFSFGGLGKMGALGHRTAVADVLGIQVSGFLAWWLWRTIYLAKLPGWARRIKVATSWTLDLFLQPDLVQLRAGSSGGLRHEHYEPGQAVFQQGDVGDSIFVIVNGSAEVLREEGARNSRLACLGAGEVFGEMALLGSSVRNATVRCLEPMTLLRLPRRDFRLLDASLPALRRSFEEVAATRN
ncbi:MAG TPA: FAD-dependent oxidoreductase [Candidatus Binatia bacterium]|jgi:NADH dehydrogenase